MNDRQKKVRPVPGSNGQEDVRIIEEDVYVAEATGGVFRADRPALTDRVEAKLTWDLEKSAHGLFFHLSAFLVDEDDQVPSGNPYFNVNHDNNRSKDGSTERVGFKPHGDGGTRHETITVQNLQWVQEDVQRIYFVGYLQTGAVEHHFTDVQDGLVTFTEILFDGRTHVFESHPLNTDYGEGHRAVLIGALERRQSSVGQPTSEWVYVRVGDGYRNLMEVGKRFGVRYI